LFIGFRSYENKKQIQKRQPNRIPTIN